MNKYFLHGKLVKKQGRKATGLKLYAMAAGLPGLIPDNPVFIFCVYGRSFSLGKNCEKNILITVNTVNGEWDFGIAYEAY